MSVILSLIARRFVKPTNRRSWLLVVPPLIFALFSLDEVAQLHEGFGGVLDRLVLDVPRALSPFPKTGVFIVLFGIPFTLLTLLLLVALRPFLKRSPSAFARIACGVVFVVAGAFGVEAVSNFVLAGSMIATLQVLVEEVMELVGSTLILWGSHGLAREVGALHDPAEAPRP